MAAPATPPPTGAPAAPAPAASSLANDSLIGFISGAAFGMTSLIVGHPFDTIKTKMQAQSIHASGGAWQVVKTTFAKEGIVGLYRGCIPPLLGASALRSAQFGAFETVHGALKGHALTKTRLLGTDLTTWVGGIASGMARTLIECPIEVAKVRRQVGGDWQWRGLYRGVTVNGIRNVGLMTSFFVLVDNTKEMRVGMHPIVASFFTGSVCATAAWLVIFPFDVAKSRVQGTTGDVSLVRTMKEIYASQGVKGLYRGIGPGTVRSLIANGFSMVVYKGLEAALKGEKYF